MRPNKLAKAMLMGATCLDCEKECFALPTGERSFTVEQADKELDILVRAGKETICKKFKWNIKGLR